jgi:glycosyltransferase involved in cell wall biosynthesis
VNRRLRVLYYTENYTVGGCDRFLADLVRNLDPEVFAASLAGNPNPAFDRWLATRLPAHLPRHEVAVSTLPNSRLVHRADRLLARRGSDNSHASAPSQGIAMRAGAAILRYEQAVMNYVRLRRLFRRIRPDVVHINNGGYPGGETCRLAALAARAEGVGGIIHFVHSTASAPSFPVRVERAFDRRIDEATALWVTAADRAGSALHEQRNIARNRIETVHYGIEIADSDPRDGSRAQESDGRPVIAVVASLDPGKGHAVLVDALAALKRTGVETTTLLIGNGPERHAIEKRSAHAGLADDVRLLGWRNDVDELLAASDLLVLPSIAYECLPYSILEAMSHRLPVVATDLAGIPEEVVDGVTGRVVPPGDARALATAIREVVGDPARARAMGEEGRERVTTHFGLETMVARMSEIYLRVAREGSTAR